MIMMKQRAREKPKIKNELDVELSARGLSLGQLTLFSNLGFGFLLKKGSILRLYKVSSIFPSSIRIPDEHV